jgi:hypothetical protein
MAQGLLTEPLPPLRVGQNHTDSSAIHKIDFVGQLMDIEFRAPAPTIRTSGVSLLQCMFGDEKALMTSRLMPWPNFEREVIRAFSSPNIHWSNDTPDVRIVGAGAAAAGALALKSAIRSR